VKQASQLEERFGPEVIVTVPEGALAPYCSPGILSSTSTQLKQDAEVAPPRFGLTAVGAAAAAAAAAAVGLVIAALVAGRLAGVEPSSCAVLVMVVVLADMPESIPVSCGGTVGAAALAGDCS
jgi:hypothetical protein